MVTNHRWRAVLAHVSFWLVTAGAVTYFAHHAMNGAHGLKAARTFEAEIAELGDKLAAIRRDKRALEHRVELLDGATLDPDLLEEQARQQLGFLHPRDRVLILPAN